MNKELQLKELDKTCPKFKNGTSKRELRHNFFSNITTEIQAYLLGFHAADGSINLERNTLRVKLTKSDNEIIELFRFYISPDASIRENESFESVIRNKKVLTKESIEINIASKILTSDITNLGFGENKTYLELSLPNIQEDLIRHFIRGYFDGDGSISIGIRNPNPKNREKNYRVTAQFSVDSKKIGMLEDIQLYLEKNNIKTNINYMKRDDLYRLGTSSKKTIEKMFKFLYDDCNFYLSRKFNKFNYYVNTEVSQIIADHRNA